MWRLRVARRFLRKLGNGDNWQSYPARFFVRMQAVFGPTMMNLFMEVY